MRIRGIGDEDQNDEEDMSEYEEPGVQLAWFGWEEYISVQMHTGSGLVHANSGMANWLAHEIF